MSETVQSQVEVTDILQKAISAERFTFSRREAARANLNIELLAGDDSPNFRETRCSAELVDEAGDVIFSCSSVVRLEFSYLPDDEHLNKHWSEVVSDLALRVSYPYHRTAISNSASSAGIPGLILPLTPDSSLRVASLRSHAG
jgi:hypothetical protein